MDITWGGFFNARDLGGIPTLDGGRTRPGAYIRSADPRFVTEAGWREARLAGVRTIVDLRNHDEVRAVHAAGMDRAHVPLDDADDLDFWRPITDNLLHCCPLYYPAFLEHKAERCAAAITALARARPGVVFHCQTGRDRTGLIALLLLALANAEPSAIAEDYRRSTEALKRLFARLNQPDQGPLIEAVLAAKHVTLQEAIEATLEGLDAENCLLAAGVRPADIATIRARLT